MSALTDRLRARHAHAEPLPAPKSELRKFLGDTLPPVGHYCIVLLPEGRHLWTDSLDNLAKLAERHADRERVYFGTASFQSRASRKQTNVLAMQSLRLDIDAGPKKIASHGEDAVYATQEQAIAALEGFEEVTGLTPTYTVSSGAGLHVYYCLDEAIDPQAWLSLAEGLSRLCSQHGLKIDPTVTEDSARILRPIGGLHSNGNRVSVIKDTGKIWQADEIVQVLGATVEAHPAPPRLKSSGINSDVLEHRDNTPADFQKIKEGCEAVRYATENQSKVDEPQWRGLLGLAKHCKDALKHAHESSREHPEYDPEATEAKLDGWTAGPTTCDYFAQRNPSACNGCAHRGKIKSPIVLGTVGQGAAQVEVSPRLDRAQLKTNLPDWSGRPDDEGNMVRIKPLNTGANVEALAGVQGWQICRNEMTKRTEITRVGLVIPSDDQDNTSLALFGDDVVRAGMSRMGLTELVDAVATRRRYHPVQQWIEAHPWDGVPRLEIFFDALALADETKTNLRNLLMRKWLVQAVAALLEPNGVDGQGVLVLAGPQNAGKTYWCSHLCPVDGAVRTGLNLDPLNKDSLLSAIGSWIVELGELDSTTRRADVAALKAFITRREDVVRQPYARRDSTYKRRTVYTATVNGTGFLVDDTGNRRFWVIEVTHCNVLPPDVMQQVWAEALTLYRAGERWNLDAETLAELNASNVAHTIVEPLKERIQTGFDWESVKWSTVDPKEWRNCPDVVWLTATDICMAVGIDRPTRAESTRAGAIVRELHRLSGQVIPQGITRQANGTRLLAVPKVRTRRE